MRPGLLPRNGVEGYHTYRGVELQRRTLHVVVLQTRPHARCRLACSHLCVQLNIGHNPCRPDPQSGLSPLVSVLAWFVGGVGAFSLLRTAFLSWAQVQANKQARKQFLEEQKQKQQLQQARRYGRRAAGDQPQADQNGGSGPVAVEVEVEVEVEAGGRAPGTSKAGGAKDVAEAEWRGDRGPGQQPEADGEVEQQQAEEGVKVQIASYRVPSTKVRAA